MVLGFCRHAIWFVILCAWCRLFGTYVCTRMSLPFQEWLHGCHGFLFIMFIICMRAKLEATCSHSDMHAFFTLLAGWSYWQLLHLQRVVAMTRRFHISMCCKQSFSIWFFGCLPQFENWTLAARVAYVAGFWDDQRIPVARNLHKWPVLSVFYALIGLVRSKVWWRKLLMQSFAKSLWRHCILFYVPPQVCECIFLFNVWWDVSFYSMGLGRIKLYYILCMLGANGNCTQ